MPIQCLIRANDAQESKGILKGMVEVVKDEPCVWGGREGLPDYVIVRIPDSTKEQAEYFLSTWKNTFEYSVINAGETKQITLTVDPAIFTVLGKSIKQDLIGFLVFQAGATIVDQTPTSVIFDIPNTVDFPELKSQLHDLFDEAVGFRIYMFRETDVDLAIANGGTMETTKAQALNRIIDRRI